MRKVEVHIREIVDDPSCRNRCCRVVLETPDGAVAFPVVVSAYDARPIVAAFDHGSVSRPQAHDLMCHLLDLASFRLHEVQIVRFERGVFYARLLLEGDSGMCKVDCRPSDALTLALKCGAPVYVDASVLRQVTLLAASPVSDRYSEIEMLEQELERLVGQERYEEAAVVRDRIQRLKACPDDFPADPGGCREP